MERSESNAIFGSEIGHVARLIDLPLIFLGELTKNLTFQNKKNSLKTLRTSTVSFKERVLWGAVFRR